MIMKAIAKNLEKNSKFNEYDEDGDGIVSDRELEHLREIKETEALLRKELAQLRMARYTLIAMGLFTAVMFLPWIPLERVEAMGNVSSLFYISGAGIVGAYMGVSAWMSKRG
tara:strand:+ start:13997 stop:14332 length:336 start_codon:yes stop_codon:yes gene_type:complete